MKRRIINRARLVLAIFSMDERARQFTLPTLALPLRDRRDAWDKAYWQTAHAAFVHLLLHGLEPEFEVHVLPGVEQRLTDGFASELVQDAIHEFRDRLDRTEIALLARLGRSAETSAAEEGLTEAAVLHRLLVLSMKLSTLALSEVEPADMRLDTPPHARR